MFVRSSIRGNAAAAKSRCLSQVKKRYVTSAVSDPLGPITMCLTVPTRSEPYVYYALAYLYTAVRRIVMKTRTLTLMLLLLGAAGVASADESMEFQNRGPKEGDGYQAWSHDWRSPTLGTAAVARVTEDDGHGDVAKSHYGVNSSSSAALQAPEIDAATLVVALTLLGGALAVLCARRAVKHIVI